ncbi:MAG TPA: AMP-binding protein [Candidatus Limnocylindria bacterium]|nr:AMP-binding protein [Candidatus Limnocylindria bacterium]
MTVERVEPAGATLIDLLRESAARYADRPALLIKPGFRTRIWTYRDLVELAPRVARVLSEQGLERGDRVLIWGVNRPEWSLGFFGALFAGLVLVPLDVRSQPDFVAKVAQRTRAKLVLASTQTAPMADGLGLPVVLIESLPDRARQAAPLPTPPVAASDLVEVVFTSGTTGEPKGAMLTHANLVANASALKDVFPFQPDERLLSILPLSHMFEQTCGLIAPFLVGAAIVYPVSRQPAVLIRTFREFRVTMLLIVPAGLKLLDSAIQRKVDASGKHDAFERLHRVARRLPRFLRRLLFRPVISQFGGRFRTLAIGAAALEEDLANRWTDMGFDVLQGYGATELSPAVAFTRPARNRIGTVGEAVPGVEIRIADDGEIQVRGPSVFAGYWEDPEATRAAIDDEGFYHTGDIGQLDADGFLTLRGRKKDMLAMPDGTKVYPEDIEAVLARDARLRDATVVGWQPPRGELRVQAVLLLEDPSVADAVVRDANAQLGAHQQIRGVTIWPDDDLPRTHTLKVKKRLVLDRLAEMESGVSGTHAAGGAPSASPLGAATVEGLVASVANLPVASVQADSRLSTDLNMDSLARIELLGVIEEELGTFVDDGDLDPDTTVAELSAMVDAAKEQKHDTGIFAWPLSPLARGAGILIQTLLLVPIFFSLYRVRVTGLERLRGLQGPVLFTPNHCLHNDVGIILTRFPLAWRWHLSVAAAADDIFGNPIRGIGSALIGNAFPLAREGAVRRSLELLGARLDRGFSILIFPEGKLTVGGPTQPFKSGTGMVAVLGATPVVPMKLEVARMSRLDARREEGFSGESLPWRGEVELVFGDPIQFAWDTDHLVATQQLEAAVAAL